MSEYNTPIRFDGDIIITDPCYITKEDPDRFKNMPYWWDFLSKTKVETMEDGSKRYHSPKPSDYPDCQKKLCKRSSLECSVEELIAAAKAGTLGKGEVYTDYSPTLEAERKAYEEADKKWQEENMTDWEKSNCGEDMDLLGFHTFLTADTIYGDWSCTVLDENKEKIGEFCADGGMVGVFLLDEVLRYNPGFDYHINRLWTTTLIKDFHGEIEIHLDDDGETVRVIGRGNINFESIQTGL